ncbi:MAG: CDP-alcohol phosphatidyltransferase family protein [Victivallales bacterium]
MARKNFKEMIANNKWLKIIPTSLTICNSLCGFAAILFTLHVYEGIRDPESVLRMCAYIILAAMVFDALDGFAARIFNAASMHGMQMDSLADMVTFGVAPAVIVAVMAHHLREQLKPMDYYIVWGLCALYLGCAALRLATYNVYAIFPEKKKQKHEGFSGLPSPGAAAGVCSLVIYYCMKEGELKQILAILPFYAGFLGLMMVSTVRYTHIGKWIQSVRRNRIRLVMLIIFVLALIIWKELAAVVLINYYILSGPVIEIYLRIKEKKQRDSLARAEIGGA